MATHSSILAWKIPWAEDSGGLQPIGSQSVTQLSVRVCTHMRVRARARAHTHTHTFVSQEAGARSSGVQE